MRTSNQRLGTGMNKPKPKDEFHRVRPSHGRTEAKLGKPGEKRRDDTLRVDQEPCPQPASAEPYGCDERKKIDQLGRMLRHLYPKGKSWASAEDRKLYWKTIVELQRTSKMLRGEK